MVFAGTTEAKLDAKGRVFFPSEFRHQLNEGETELVLQRDIYQPCIVVYPSSVWLEQVNQLRLRLNRWQPREAMAFRQFMASAQKATLDSNGRLLVPRKLLEACHIDHLVTFIGVDDRVEMWNSERMNAAFFSEADLAQSMEILSAGWNTASPPLPAEE